MRHPLILPALVCLSAGTSRVATADELTPPWRAGRCTLWTRLPPAMRYLAPLETDEGLWAPANDGPVLMRLQDSWTMSLSPAQFDGRFKLLAEGDGWVAAVAVTRSTPLSSKIYVRTDGRWTDIAEVSYPAISFRGVDLEYSAGASRNLFVADGNANVFHYDVDAVAWRSVTPSTRGPARGLWGDLYNLYLLYQFGSSVEM